MSSVTRKGRFRSAVKSSFKVHAQPLSKVTSSYLAEVSSWPITHVSKQLCSGNTTQMPEPLLFICFNTS